MYKLTLPIFLFLNLSITFGTFNNSALKFLATHYRNYHLLNIFHKKNDHPDSNNRTEAFPKGNGPIIPSTKNWLVGSGSTANSSHHNYTFYKTYHKTTLELENRFRFGPRSYERFLDVFFSRDPWSPDELNRSHVNFVGSEEELGRFPKNAVCHYKFPFEEKIKINAEGVENYCKLPAGFSEVTEANVKPEDFYVTLDLVLEGTVILKDIRVNRVPAPQRVHYTYTVCTMVVDLFAPQLKEWLAYNILIGTNSNHLQCLFATGFQIFIT